MKAAVYYARHDLRVTDIPEFPVGDNDIKVSIKYCGVCGTDVHIYEGDDGSAPVTSGTVIGHEASGVVAEVGKNVKGFKPGDRVAMDPNEVCGHCYFCRQHNAHYCENIKGYGTTKNGSFAEFLTIPATQVFHIPDSLSFEAAAMTETLSCCLHGIDLANIEIGQTVFIIGAGSIGLIMLQLALLAGAGKVIVSEPVETKRELAKKNGAFAVLDPKTQDIKAELAKLAPNVDRVIECVGSTVTAAQAIELAGKKATVVLFGLTPPKAEIAVKPYELFLKETTVVASYINPYTFDRSIELLANSRIKLDDIVTDIVPLSEINKVFEDDGYRKRGKVLIKM